GGRGLISEIGRASGRERGVLCGFPAAAEQERARRPAELGAPTLDAQPAALAHREDGQHLLLVELAQAVLAPTAHERAALGGTGAAARVRLSGGPAAPPLGSPAPRRLPAWPPPPPRGRGAPNAPGP